eukprot:483690-Amphidinium_carterae.1
MCDQTCISKASMQLASLPNGLAPHNLEATKPLGNTKEECQTLKTKFSLSENSSHKFKKSKVGRVRGDLEVLLPAPITASMLRLLPTFI